MKKIFLYGLLIFLSCFFFVPLVKADTVDISEVPQRLATALGLELLAGRMLASSIFLCLTVFPTLLLTNKYKNQGEAAIVVGILSIGFLVAAGWLSYWFLLIISLITAYLFSTKIKEFITK